MIIEKRKPGRPRKEKPLDGPTRSKRLRAKRLETGTRELRFVVDGDTATLFQSLRERSQFSVREQSEFFAALVLKVANKPWLGTDFILPIEEKENA
ncbi:hypothetical protein ACW5WQ_21190 [Aeromonas rivuli]|uniref:hypothetical protein n=1 Tax=Aeromonas rivuli TaxID=648794 RepID=UPI0005A67162|nr:hypothetical protein [Aeromonas rivuli]